MSRALFYTLIPGVCDRHGGASRPQILVVEQFGGKFYLGRLLDGTRTSERPRHCLGYFTTPGSAREALARVRTIYAAHRIATRPYRDAIAALDKQRDAALADLIPPPPTAAKEQSHAA